MVSWCFCRTILRSCDLSCHRHPIIISADDWRRMKDTVSSFDDFSDFGWWTDARIVITHIHGGTKKDLLCVDKNEDKKAYKRLNKYFSVPYPSTLFPPLSLSYVPNLRSGSLLAIFVNGYDFPQWGISGFFGHRCCCSTGHLQADMSTYGSLFAY